jgi:hypothetical protein
MARRGLVATIGAARWDVKKCNRHPSAAPACYNQGMRECPLCGESMRLSEREVQEKNGTMRQVREWICPECDYFEEADLEG